MLYAFKRLKKDWVFFAVQFIRCGCCCCGCWSLALAAVIWSVCIFVFVHGFAPLKWAKTSTTTTTNDYFDHDVKYFCCFSFHSLACACVSNMNLLLLFVASILYDDFKSSEMRNVWNVLMSSKFFFIVSFFSVEFHQWSTILRNNWLYQKWFSYLTWNKCVCVCVVFLYSFGAISSARVKWILSFQCIFVVYWTKDNKE